MPDSITVLQSAFSPEQVTFLRSSADSVLNQARSQVDEAIRERFPSSTLESLKNQLIFRATQIVDQSGMQVPAIISGNGGNGGGNGGGDGDSRSAVVSYMKYAGVGALAGFGYAKYKDEDVVTHTMGGALAGALVWGLSSYIPSWTSLFGSYNAE